MGKQPDTYFAFLPLGALIQEFRVAGRNIVLALPDEEAYRKYNAPYFGSTIGRTTNRLKDSVVKNLNDKTYVITTKEGPNSLHGGKEGWNSRLFDGPKPVHRKGRESVEFRYTSRHGEEGYPGTVELRVWYIAGKEAGKTELEIEYEVEFTGSECDETVVGVTNHSYFNLGDDPTIRDTEAVLSTDKYLPTDSTGIPLGTIESYGPLRVTEPFMMDENSPDFDNCFIVDTNPGDIPLDTRPRDLMLLASFKHQESKMHLEVLSTEPAFQFYTGQHINVPAVGRYPARGPRSGFCIEPSRYINAPNVPEWQKMCLLKRGQIWGARTVYRCWKG
ncbi:aldose 1-epimerase [Nannizzia gypsea CBS 118893]|uniref:Aldose 1-epimerase n=1 Tax=Arthroderma gypseum (strain ATCC MYA-4604 / CBS 118893) TaxID=535722 RepID=E4UX17_ARTGP|nr:aldose 1-epimerase [Nannizzia gypsea CBS 118893]EFR02656.1 aldose 1-epimerase [Nannizzia gypsea CBS 118893]